MKHVALIIILTCLCLKSFCQKDSGFVFPFNVFSVSVNKTNIQNDFTENRFGYGFGIYHIGDHHGKLNKKVNFIIGFEYNRINYFSKWGDQGGDFYYESDVTYARNTYTLPLTLRFNIAGNKTKFFIEPGAFLDLTFISKKGTLHTSYPFQPAGTYSFNEGAGDDFNFGASFGLGVSFPLSKYEIVFKPDYKFRFASINYEPPYYLSYYRIMVMVKFF